MKRFASLLCGLTALVAPALASAQSTDFNGGTIGSAVGSFYAAQGVTFSNAKFDQFPVYGAESAFLGGVQISAISSEYNPTANSPIVITFNDLLGYFSIYGTNVGQNGARAEAFDAMGNSLGYAENFGMDVGQFNNPLLTLAFSGMKSVRLYQPTSSSFEGMLWDNMSWRPQGTSVPEPASAVLLLTGVAGLVMVRRRAR
ncbi:VPLPA-CTERM sorting domain-containing protein [Gemmatimonas sp.]